MSTIKVSNLQNASAASPAIVLDANSRATLNGLSYPTEGSLSGRNRIINGSFEIWQRGTSTTTTGNTYLADRWQSSILSTGGTVSQETASVPAGSRYAWKYVASASNTGMQMGQQIEFANCLDLQNATASISFMARSVNSNTGSTALTVRTRTIAGVDGACMFAGPNSDTSVTLTTTWTRYTVTRTLPATFGSLSLEFVLGSHVSGDGIMLAQVQLEAGSVATPFERRSYGQELALCQRYYYQIGGNTFSNPTSALYGIFGSGITYTTSQADISIPLKVSMRSTPTLSQGTAAVQQGANVYAATSISDAGSTPNVIFARVGIGTASLTAGGGANYFANNSATGFFAAASEL